MNGGGDLFKQIKKMRNCKPIVATSMDGVKNDIKDHFKNRFEAVYNSADDKLNILRVQEEIEGKVDQKNLSRPGKSCKMSSSGKFRDLQCPQNSAIHNKG